MQAIVEGVAAAYGCTAQFKCEFCSPATDNDPMWCDFAADIARAQGLNAVLDPTSMLGEDFALFQEKVPGVYIHAGIGLTAPNHNPKFCVDQACLESAADYNVALITAALRKLAAG